MCLCTDSRSRRRLCGLGILVIPMRFGAFFCVFISFSAFGDLGAFRCGFLRFNLPFPLLEVLGAFSCVFNTRFPLLDVLGAFFCVFCVFLRFCVFCVFCMAREASGGLDRVGCALPASPGSRSVRSYSFLFVPSRPFPSLWSVSGICGGSFASFVLFSSFTLSVASWISLYSRFSPDLIAFGENVLAIASAILCGPH